MTPTFAATNQQETDEAIRPHRKVRCQRRARTANTHLHRSYGRKGQGGLGGGGVRYAGELWGRLELEPLENVSSAHRAMRRRQIDLWEVSICRHIRTYHAPTPFPPHPHNIMK